MSEFINTIDVLGDDVVIDSIIDRTITEFRDNRVETVGNYAFYDCTALETVNLPNVKFTRPYAFAGCTALTTVELPNIEIVEERSFLDCSALSRIELPKVTGTLGAATFRGCKALSYVSIPNVSQIYEEAFINCFSLTTLVLPSVSYIHWQVFKDSGLKHLVLSKQAVCTLNNTSSFIGTPIASGTGYIYVPAALVDSYKAATNWSTYAAQFRALEDYTVDGTITGELDETKIAA